jgi:hypothetical protein
MEQKDLETLTAAGMLRKTSEPTKGVLEYELTWEGRTLLRSTKHMLQHMGRRCATSKEFVAWAGTYVDTYLCRTPDTHWYIEAFGANTHTRRYWAWRKASELVALNEPPPTGTHVEVTPNPRIGGWLAVSHAIYAEEGACL